MLLIGSTPGYSRSNSGSNPGILPNIAHKKNIFRILSQMTPSSIPGEEGEAGEVAAGCRPHDGSPPVNVLQVAHGPLHKHSHNLRVSFHNIKLVSLLIRRR